MMDKTEQAGHEAADDLIWGFIRIFVGWWPVMIMAGILHHELDQRIPTLSYVQAVTVSLTLTLVAWFFQR